MPALTTDFTAEWGDCDEAGIVFYPNYFYWMDCAFQRLLRSRGLGPRQIRERFDGVTPLVDVGASFMRPVMYGDQFTVEVAVGNWTPRRARFSYRFTKRGVLCAEGFEVRAFAVVTTEGLRGSDFPRALREQIDGDDGG